MEYLLSGTHTEFNTNVCHGFYYCKNIRPWLLSKCIKNTQQVPITYVLPQPMNKTRFRPVLAVVTQCMLGCCWILWTANSNIKKMWHSSKKVNFFRTSCMYKIKRETAEQSCRSREGKTPCSPPLLLLFPSYSSSIHPSISVFQTHCEYMDELVWLLWKTSPFSSQAGCRVTVWSHKSDCYASKITIDLICRD